MTTFTGGPADGQIMKLRRAPDFLRVTQRGGTFDALDMLADETEADETVCVYVLSGVPTKVHISAGKDSGWFMLGTYLFYAYQPFEHQMRNTERWQQWCRDEKMRNRLSIEYGVPMLQSGITASASALEARTAPQSSVPPASTAAPASGSQSASGEQGLLL
jgi:hypothetical protein